MKTDEHLCEQPAIIHIFLVSTMRAPPCCRCCPRRVPGPALARLAMRWHSAHAGSRLCQAGFLTLSLPSRRVLPQAGPRSRGRCGGGRAPPSPAVTQHPAGAPGRAPPCPPAGPARGAGRAGGTARFGTARPGGRGKGHPGRQQVGASLHKECAPRQHGGFQTAR